MPVPQAVGYAQWCVMWISKGKVHEHNCGGDFHEALRIYRLVVKAGKKGCTLRSMNVSFPPPEKYAGKMRAVNAKGLWWCPFCVEIRRFIKRSGRYTEEGIYVEMPSMCCPMCEISHAHGAVMKYNPVASRYNDKRRRRGKKARADA